VEGSCFVIRSPDCLTRGLGECAIGSLTQRGYRYGGTAGRRKCTHRDLGKPFLLPNHFEQALGRKRLLQERRTDRHRLHSCPGNDDNVHRVSAAGILGEFSP
jgi:hypothetical protein